MSGKEVTPAQSSSPQAELNALVSLFNAQRFAEVERGARAFVDRYPGAATGWKLLGISLHMQGKDSLPTLQKTAELFPGDASVHNNLGNAYRDRNQSDDAIACYRRALAIKPDFLGTNYNLGVLLHEIGQINEAMVCCGNELRLDAGYAEVHNLQGSLYKEFGQLEEALKCFRRALELKPDFIEAYSNALFILNYTTYTPEHCLEEARRFGKVATSLAQRPFTAWRCVNPPQRLRIGLVSGDLLNHPVGHFLESILGQIDSHRVELVAYSTNRRTDELTTRIRPYFSEWRYLSGQSDEAAAQLIHADGVHVLVDLSGHTGYSRLPVFAWKPAPVQVSWLGYFATTGIAEMDYLLADQVGVPEARRGDFTESVWYLPDTRLCFTAPKVNLAVSPLPSLSNGVITFGCYQSLPKLGDDVLAVWGEILAAIPNARLRFQRKQLGEPEVAAQLLQRLQHYGIPPERVTLHGNTHRDAYLASHAEVDMILDTFPYPGGTTTCEALWMGVPTLTLTGDSLRASQGASLTAAAGLSDWIAADKEAYIAKAIAFAGDLPKLAALRAGLRDQVLASPLFDASRFAKNLEHALWGMWEARQKTAI
ncbi:MAG: tetratricopeptide repeat protein [Pseudomonadota bacterium]